MCLLFKMFVYYLYIGDNLEDIENNDIDDDTLNNFKWQVTISDLNNVDVLGSLLEILLYILDIL